MNHYSLQPSEWLYIKDPLIRKPRYIKFKKLKIKYSTWRKLIKIKENWEWKNYGYCSRCGLGSCKHLDSDKKQISLGKEK